MRELIVSLDSALEREMSKYPDVDWSEVVRRAILNCIHCKEISEVYTASIERALSQET